MSPGNQVLKMQMETPLIGSGSQEEVDLRVAAIIDLGKTRGYLTYEELNQKLPDEVVSPDKLDSLLMMIDEMGIRLIDESDVAEFTAKPRKGKTPKLKPTRARSASAFRLTSSPFARCSSATARIGNRCAPPTRKSRMTCTWPCAVVAAAR